MIKLYLSYLDCNSCLYYYNNRFDIVGYGCMTCIGNSGPLPEPVSEAIEKGECLAYCINTVIRCELMRTHHFCSLRAPAGMSGHWWH